MNFMNPRIFIFSPPYTPYFCFWKTKYPPRYAGYSTLKTNRYEFFSLR